MDWKRFGSCGDRARPTFASPLLVALLPLLALLVGSACGESSSPGEPRVTNAILIVVDALRADHLGAYGYERATSPGLDAWSARGRLLENALAAAPWTLPSFASMYTGAHPSRHGAGRLLRAGFAQKEYGALDPSLPTLAEILAQRGFATAAIVSNPWLHADHGIARGFEHYDYEHESYRKSRRADATVDRALAWLDARDPRPFLLVVHFMDPHMGYDPPRSVRGRFTSSYASKLTLPVLNLIGLRSGRVTLEDEDRDFVAAAYDEELLFVDQELDRLLTEIAARALFDDTLIVLTSDHGEELFDHGGFEHGHSAFQELLHVPLIFWGPGISPGRSAVPVAHVDLFDTLLDALIGRAGPETRTAVEGHGSSLWPLLVRAEPPPERALVSEGTILGPERAAIVRWPWKAIAGSGNPVLFDLASDPRERINLAGREPARLASLVDELQAFQRAAARERGPDERLELDARERGQLEALGYLE